MSEVVTRRCGAKSDLQMVGADQRHGDLAFARMRPAGQHVIEESRADKVLVVAHLADEAAGAVVEAQPVVIRKADWTHRS